MPKTVLGTFIFGVLNPRERLHDIRPFYIWWNWSSERLTIFLIALQQIVELRFKSFLFESYSPGVLNPRGVRNRVEQQEVSGGWLSEASPVFTAAPHHSHYHLSAPSCSTNPICEMSLNHPETIPLPTCLWENCLLQTSPWCQKDWGPLLWSFHCFMVKLLWKFIQNERAYLTLFTSDSE